MQPRTTKPRPIQSERYMAYRNSDTSNSESDHAMLHRTAHRIATETVGFLGWSMITTRPIDSSHNDNYASDRLVGQGAHIMQVLYGSAILCYREFCRSVKGLQNVPPDSLLILSLWRPAEPSHEWGVTFVDKKPAWHLQKWATLR